MVTVTLYTFYHSKKKGGRVQGPGLHLLSTKAISRGGPWDFAFEPIDPWGPALGRSWTHTSTGGPQAGPCHPHHPGPLASSLKERRKPAARKVREVRPCRGSPLLVDGEMSMSEETDKPLSQHAGTCTAFRPTTKGMGWGAGSLEEQAPGWGLVASLKDLKDPGSGVWSPLPTTLAPGSTWSSRKKECWLNKRPGNAAAAWGAVRASEQRQSRTWLFLTGEHVSAQDRGAPASF